MTQIITKSQQTPRMFARTLDRSYPTDGDGPYLSRSDHVHADGDADKAHGRGDPPPRPKTGLAVTTVAFGPPPVAAHVHASKRYARQAACRPNTAGRIGRDPFSSFGRSLPRAPRGLVGKPGYQFVKPGETMSDGYANNSAHAYARSGTWNTTPAGPRRQTANGWAYGD